MTMLPVLTSKTLSPLPRVRHGFFTREGGVSTGVYASLNCAIGTQDEPVHVLENRHLVAQAIGVGVENLLTLQQIHGAQTVHVTHGFDIAERPEADAMVTRRTGLALGILTADCVPVLLCDAQEGVIGAAHAGWRGASAGIIESVVAAMERLGAARANIHAALGPCIWQDSYEVGPEFPARFLDEDPANNRFFLPSDKRGHFLFDLPGYVMGKLGTSGVTSVAFSPADTFADQARFFSYRRSYLRDEPQMGRMISVIALSG